MTWQMLVIAIYRVVGSLPVLRRPFVGGLIALLCDFGDLFLMSWLGGVTNYQAFDKLLDQVYMLAFLVVVFGWPRVERGVAVGLYAYRLVGLVAFEVTGARTVLLFFPNFFEVWFLLIAGARHFGVQRPTSVAWVWWGAAALMVAKVTQEYVLHSARWLDSFTAFEAVEAIWRWLIGLV